MATAPPSIAGLSDWRPLARGGFSVVWQARQDSLGRQVAVKVDFRPLDDDKQRRRFLREAAAAGRLSGHPGIVTVHDAGILPDDRPYLVLELCSGGSLSSWLAPEKRPSIERVRDVGVRIADALAAAHARGVIHRDVKPANILVDAYGNVGLTDFGLAALPEPGAELSVTMEALTPAYAPPEVFSSEPPTDAGDIYSLAATLYALLAGHPPRWPTDGHAPTLSEMLALHGEPIERLPGVPPSLMDVLTDGLAAEPSERPTAAEFRDRLAAVDLGPDAAIDRRAMALTGGGTGSPRSVSSTPSPITEDPGQDDGSGDSSSGDPESGAGSGSGDGLVDTGGNLNRPGEDSEDRPQQRRFLVAIVALALLLTGGIIVASLTNGRSAPADPVASPGVGQPSAGQATAGQATAGQPSGGQSSGGGSTGPTSGSPSAASPSPSPSVPDGFVRCPELGEGALCPTQPECWGSLQGVSDVPVVATPIDCTESHPAQTFVAIELPYQLRTQSQLENAPQIKALCSRAVLTKQLTSGRIGANWQIQPIPYKVFPDADNISRCLVLTGTERTSPLKFRYP